MTSADVDSIWLPMAIVLNSDSLDHESRLYYFVSAVESPSWPGLCMSFNFWTLRFYFFVE
jgi:hypothetical protein